MKNVKAHVLAAAAASLLGLGGVMISNNQNVQPQKVEAASSSVVTVNYVKGYGIAVWNSPYAGHTTTGKKLQHGTSWKITGTTTVNGAKWYSLGGNQWIPASYTSAGYPQVAQAASSVQSVINLAKKQIGKPYVWGAKGPSSFDCSGLMYYVFKNAVGKNIGGYTVAQESAGQHVSISNLKAGDLIFWGAAGATYHVALYIGNGQYIHAPQPGQTVRIQSLSGYFMPSFGVRVL